MTHPLTDEMCYDIGLGYSFPDRMRSAADWQLEECLEELHCLLSIFGAKGEIKEEAVPIIVELFKSNMRPQEGNL